MFLVPHASAATVWADPSSNGDGSIQDAIDAADPGDTIWLKTGTFWVDDTIEIDKSLTFDGDGEVKIIDDAGWGEGKVVFSASGVDHITFKGITIDGNSQGNTDEPFGKGYYGLFLFRNCDYVTFDGIRLEYAKSDGIIYRNGNHITVKNCDIYMMGHEGLYSLYSNYVEFTNNKVFTRTNSACRIASGMHVLISNNEIYSGSITSVDGGGSSTGPGIEINIDAGQPADDIEICNNYIHDLRGSGIWMTSESTRGQNVYIHNNIIRDVGNYPTDNKYSTAGITIWQYDNTTIENNVFDDTGIAAVRWAKRSSDATVSGTFQTIVRNNIIVNVRDKISITAVPIMNSNPSNHQFIVYYNDFYNNYDTFDGEVYISKNNMFVNPKFSDSMYHLQSGSPCIAAGYNGADLGAYGSGTVGVGDIPTHDDVPDAIYEPPKATPVDNSTTEIVEDTPDEPETPIEQPQDTSNSTVPDIIDDLLDDEEGIVDNSTYEYIDEPAEDFIDNSTTEYVDNSTTDYDDDEVNTDIDNSTTETKKSSHRSGKSYNLASPTVAPIQKQVNVTVEMFVPSAEFTKPTYRGA